VPDDFLEDVYYLFIICVLEVCDPLHRLSVLSCGANHTPRQYVRQSDMYNTEGSI